MADTRVIIQAEAEQAVREFNRLRAEASGSLQQIAAAGNKVVGVLQSIGVAVSAGQIVALSDEYAKFTAQLRLATESQREYGVAYADVKRVANDSQQGLASTGVLYARIANGTRELGVSQQRVAAITETVNLALKVSGATATEAASAQLQLSQAFASGTLRGEEFNAVNEAAPRLMLALADGIGVPVGALKKMAEEGQITSKIMSDVLPDALVKLREEAKQVQTISGSFTVLKNTVMEFVGVQANASGAVAALTGGIGALSDNLAFLAGTVGILLALKTTGWLVGMATQTYASVTATLASVAANNALLASNVATATSGAAAAAAANTLAISRVAELRAAVLAAEGNVALALTTNGLIPAEANAARTAAALASANLTLAASQSAASVTARVLSASMALLSGPIGIIVTVLGAGAAAWALWGKSSEDANKLATESTEASGAEILASLEKQNQKLRDRLALAKAGNVDAAKVDSGSTDKLASTLRQINTLKAKGAEISSVEQITLIDLEASYSAISRELKQNKELTAAIGAEGAQSKAGEWMVKYANQSEKLEAELKKARTELGGAFTPELEARIRKQYEVKAAGSAKEISAYATLISSIRQKIAASDAEAAGLRPLTESQKLSAALNEQIAAGKLKLSPLNKAEYLAAIEQLAVNEQVIASNKRAVDGAAAMAKLEADSVEKAKSRLDAVVAEAVANERLVETFGLSKGAIQAIELARLEEQLAQRASTGLTLDEIANLELLIAAKRRSAGAATRLGDLEEAKTGAEELEKFLDPAKAQSFGDALRDAFGGAGSSLTKLTSSLQNYARTQAAFDQQRGNAAKKYLNGLSDEAEYAKDLANLNKQKVSDQLGGYGDMAGAAAGFFDEQSKGYKVLQGVSQAFHVAQLAMNLASIAPAIAAGAAQMFAQSGWGGFAGVAAMIGVMAGLGAVTSGGGGGGPSAKDRQASQGTGTVLGNSTAKSDSIARSLELVANNSDIDLSYTQGMLAALRNIESSMSGLGNLLVRGSGLTGELGADTGSSAQALFMSMQPFWSIGAKTVGKLVGSIFGGKTTVQDRGFTVDRTTLGAAAAGDITAKQYTDIKKSGGWFSKDKYSSPMTDLGAEANAQFAKLLAGLGAGVREAAKLLGLGGDAFTARLNSFVIDIGKISLKDKTGEEIQKELEAVFSKVGDDMAKFGISGLEPFQQVGEGYFETLTRIASNYANLDSILASSGETFGQTGIASIAARERLIEMAGGIDKLASQSSSFNEKFLTEAERLAPVQKYVTENLAALGYAGIDSRDKFKDAVLGLVSSGALATEAGAKTYTSMMALADSVAQVYAANKDLIKSEQGIADERKDLQNKLDELTMTQEQLAKKARDAIDGHNLALYDQVIAAQAAKDAAAAAADASAAASKLLLDGVSQAFSAVRTAVEVQKAAESNAYQSASEGFKSSIAAVSGSVSKLQSLSQSLQSTVDGMTIPGQEKQQRQEAQAQIAAALAIAKAGGSLPDLDAIKGALSTVAKDASSQFVSYTDYMRDLYRTKNSVLGLSGLTDAQLSTEQLTLKTLEAQKTALDEAHKLSMAGLDATLDQAKTQTDILNGIYTSLMTLPQALAALGAAVTGAQANPTIGATTGLVGLYQSLLGRAPDAAGLSFWQTQVANGASLDTIKGAITGSSEYKKLHPFDVGTNFVPGDMPAMVHEGERIIPAADNRELMTRLRSRGGDDSALVAEIRALRAELSALKSSSARTAASSEEGTGLLKRVIRNDRLFTKEVA